MDKSTNELKTFCKLSNGSVQHTKTVVDHTCKLTTSHVENTYQIRQFVNVIHIVLFQFECVALSFKPYMVLRSAAELRLGKYLFPSIKLTVSLTRALTLKKYER